MVNEPTDHETARETLRQLEEGVASLARYFEAASADPGAVDEVESSKAVEPTAAAAAELDVQRAEFEKQAADLALRSEELAAQQEDVARWSEAARGAEHLQEELWPEWLRSGQLSEWKDRLQIAILSGESTPSAALFFAALHGYTAATRDSDTKALHDSLRDVSRRLFTWLREQALDECEVMEVGAQWAEEINRECRSNAEIEIPILGAPATNQWMIFRPKPGMNSPDVVSVQTWCVRNSQKQPVHRAEITV